MVVHTTTKPTGSVDPEVLEQLMAMLQDSPELLALANDTARVRLPLELVHLLKDAIGYLAAGENVRAMPERDDLSVRQAAGVLNVRPESVDQLLNDGEIQYETIGGERRIGIYRLMIYKIERDAKRRRALDELTQFSQDIGLYDLPDNH